MYKQIIEGGIFVLNRHLIGCEWLIVYSCWSISLTGHVKFKYIKHFMIK